MAAGCMVHSMQIEAANWKGTRVVEICISVQMHGTQMNWQIFFAYHLNPFVKRLTPFARIEFTLPKLSTSCWKNAAHFHIITTHNNEGAHVRDDVEAPNMKYSIIKTTFFSLSPPPPFSPSFFFFFTTVTNQILAPLPTYIHT